MLLNLHQSTIINSHKVSQNSGNANFRKNFLKPSYARAKITKFDYRMINN